MKELLPSHRSMWNPGVVVRDNRLLDLPADQFQPGFQVQFRSISIFSSFTGKGGEGGRKEGGKNR
jgi:hypothetical protein